MKNVFRKRTERKKKPWDGERKFQAAFMGLMFVFLFAWAVVQPFNFSPDEEMRYKVVSYIFRHNAIPHGGDPEVLDASWGISYAFYPVLSYLVSYIFMKLVSIFTMDSFALVVAARMAEVAFGMGTAYFTMKIGRKLFKGAYQKMFLFLTMLLPGAFVLFTYINCDSLALLATSMMIYSWLLGLEDGWSYKTCVLTAVGVSACALAYYNAYGSILATVVVFVLSFLFCGEKKWQIKKMFQRGLFITAIVAVLAGWWFARSYVLYDGDILGLDITTEYAEKYASEARKPSNGYTFQQNPNVNVFDMMMYQPVNHAHNWIMMVYYSFIGSFGYMTIWPPEWIGKLFMMVFLVGIIGVVTRLRQLFAVRSIAFVEKKQVEGTRLRVKYTYRRRSWSKEAVFHWGLVIALVLPNLLNIYNSYVNDYQPQGRYSMPMIIPFMYFITKGYSFLFERVRGGERIGRIICGVVCAGMTVFLLYCYFGLVLPACLD